MWLCARVDRGQVGQRQSSSRLNRWPGSRRRFSDPPSDARASDPPWRGGSNGPRLQRRSIHDVPSQPPAPIDGGRFALDFLLRPITTTTEWEVADCHGGLVLLRKAWGFLPGLIVCDPLTRRYQGIHHPPTAGYSYADVFLLDGDDGNISISNFRVLYRFYPHGPRLCVFSSADGGDWSFLRQLTGDDDLDRGRRWHVAGRVDGSVYLGLRTGNVIVLDNASLEFSVVDLPIRVDRSNPLNRSTFTVVHGAGRDPTSPPTTWIIHVYADQALEFFHLVRGSGEWVLEHSIPQLSEATRGLPGCVEKSLECIMVNVIAGTGKAVLSVRDRGDRRWLFSIDLDTMELQVMPRETCRRTTTTFTYTLPWPQFLRACAS